MRAALIAVALAASAAEASPLRDLDLGTQSFRAKDYESTIRFVTPLLYPEEKLAEPEQLVTAHVLLGASAFEKGNRDEAKAEFEKALFLDPQKTLDPLLFTTGAVRLFDETREDIEARRKRDEELRKLEEEREKLRQLLETNKFYDVRPVWVNFVPFGAGQFQERRIGWGVVFLSSEALTLSASLGIYLYLTEKYPQVCSPQGVCTRPVPIEDVRSANTLQVTQYAADFAFLGLVGIGIWDAYRHYTARVRIKASPDLLKQLQQQPKKTSLRDRIHLAPMVTPTSVGLGLGWEN